MMGGSGDKALGDFVSLVAKNPHSGTAEQVVTLSLAIADANQTLPARTFALYKEASGLGDKVFSKLKVIGERLGQLDPKTRADVIKGLPDSYSTIQVLCSLKPEELATAIKTKQVTPKTSVRAATAYLKKVRFPRQAVAPAEVGMPRWSGGGEVLYQVFRPEATVLSEDLQLDLAIELREVCTRYGAELRKVVTTNTTALREADRREKAAFWRQVLEDELPQKWFQETDEAVRKQFNLKVVEEVWDAPLRTFTGFLIRTGGGQAIFYEEHGQAYIAKLHYLQEATENRTTRYNLKRRIEEVLAHEKGKRLAIWRNTVLKNSGIF